jgi:uncharacterized protein
VTIAFVDTGYWIAVVNPRDGLRAKAAALADSLVGWRLVTTDLVLVELLNAVSRLGQITRQAGVDMVRHILSSPDIEVALVSGSRFDRALALYEARSDKAWSLTDCASIDLMRERRISDALAHDRHFAQAGFRALLR